MRNFERYESKNQDEEPIKNPASSLKEAEKRFENEASDHNWNRNWLLRSLNLNEKTKENVATLYAEQMEDFISRETKKNDIEEAEAYAKWHILYGPTRIGLINSFDVEDATKFMKLRNSWIESSNGQLSAEAINGWSEVKSNVTNRIIELARLPGVECSEFVGFRDSWAEAGIIDTMEINKMVKKKVLERIEDYAHYNHPGIPCSKFVEVRDEWVNAGVVSLEEANSVAHKHAKKRIEDYAHYNHPGIPCSKFVEVRDEWVNAGVVSLEEANSVAHKHAKARVKEATRLPGVDETKVVDEWSAAGVI